MPSRRFYDLAYRVWAPWSLADRWEIRELVASGRCSPERLAPPDGGPARAIDLGCGEGGVAIWLAGHGFRTAGVDFSPVALAKARRAAAGQGVPADRLTFVEADLTAPEVPGLPGPFDLLVDYGTLDDLPRPERRKMAGLVTTLARPGAQLFLHAFYGRREDLPRISFTGPSRASAGLEPGDVERLFGDGWEIERLPFGRHRFIASWLLTRR